MAYRPRETGWSLLARGEDEEAGFGLYSYLLFARQPSPDMEAKYIAVIQQLLYAAPAAHALIKSGLPRSAINNTFIPVVTAQNVERLTVIQQARWILANYDYARARIILRSFAEPMRDGPYFVSASTPLGRTAAAADAAIMQDLTLTTVNNVGRWVEQFIEQASRQDFRRPESKGQLLLQLRNGLSVIAALGPSVISNVEQLVKWLAPTKTTRVPSG
jgi:hypothetical protein